MSCIVSAVSVVVFFSTTAEFLPCGDALHRAVGWLGDGLTKECIGPLWGLIVRISGCNAVTMARVSAFFGIINALLITYIGWCIFPFAIAHARTKHTTVHGSSRFLWIAESVGVLIGISFVVTPGFWVASTRLNGLMVALMFPLAALTILIRILIKGIHRHTAKMLVVSGMLTAFGCWEGSMAFMLLLPQLGCLLVIKNIHKRGFWQLLKIWLEGFLPTVFILPCLVYRSFELASSVFRGIANTMLHELLCSGVLVFALIGIVPFIALFKLIWSKRFLMPKQCFMFVVGWLLLVFAMACYTTSSGALKLGKTAAAFVDDVLARLGERIWLVSEGPLYDLFYLKKNSNIRLVSIAKDRDPEYGRMLADWALPEFGTNDDLLFAAELGPCAFLDEWSKCDNGFVEKVLLPTEYFETQDIWLQVWNRHKDGLFVKNEPHQRYIRRLFGRIGVNIGCGLLRKGKKQEAWNLLCLVANEVDRDNLSALINLSLIMNRGYVVVPAVRESILHRLRKAQEKYDIGKTRRLIASSGNVFKDVDLQKQYEELIRCANPGPQAVRLVNAINQACNNKESALHARDELRKAIDDGAVEIGKVSNLLVSLDMAIGDKNGAESDALDVLRYNRQDGTANAIMGALRGEKGDYVSAERFLRRAIRCGDVPPAAYNDLAETLIRVGKAAEAVHFAEMAVERQTNNWCFWETLSSAQLENNQLEKAEKSLSNAIEYANKCKMQSEARNSLDIMQVRLLKAQGNVDKMRSLAHSLMKRKNLRRDQIHILDWLINEDNVFAKSHRIERIQ